VALMLIKVNAAAPEQELQRLRRVRLDAGLSGGIDRVGIGSLGVLGLLAREMWFDDLFFPSLRTYEFWSWFLDIPTVARSLMSLKVEIGMLVISSLLDT
jgi:hypothetical protein